MTSGTREMICGVTASSAFLTLFFGLGFHWVGGAGLGALVYAGLRFLLPAKESRNLVAPGYDHTEWQKILAEGEAQTRKIEKLVPTTSGGKMAPRIRAIAGAMRRILARLEEDPEILPMVHIFLSVEATNVVPVLQQYVALCTQTHGGMEFKRALAESEKIIMLIGEKFEEQYQNLLRRDLAKFEVTTQALAGMLGIDEWDLERVKARSLKKKRSVLNTRVNHDEEKP